MSDIYRVSWERELTPKQKDSGFFNRIKRHRVDPTASSLANPPPDYYGEKIGSVTGYRRWLKDQRAFNLKTGRYRGAKSF
jgi:import inner membrane translocase subunit TIM23